MALVVQSHHSRLMRNVYAVAPLVKSAIVLCMIWLQVLDRYFGNVCELDLIFNFHKARQGVHSRWNHPAHFVTDGVTGSQGEHRPDLCYLASASCAGISHSGRALDLRRAAGALQESDPTRDGRPGAVAFRNVPSEGGVTIRDEGCHGGRGGSLACADVHMCVRVAAR